MNDLVKVGEVLSKGKATAVILKSQMRGTYHIYNSETGYISAEPENEREFDSFRRSMKRKGFQVVITAKIDEEPDMVTLTMPKFAWDLLKETLQMDAKSRAFDRDLRERIITALRCVRETGA